MKMTKTWLGDLVDRMMAEWRDVRSELEAARLYADEDNPHVDDALRIVDARLGELNEVRRGLRAGK